MTLRPSAGGRVRRGCPLPGSDTILGRPRVWAGACVLGAGPSPDPEAEPRAAGGETVLRLLSQYQARARLQVGSAPGGGLKVTGYSPGIPGRHGTARPDGHGGQRRGRG
jgi:3',5'-cyclic AMP phosphodiesterase CpdA